MGGGSSSESSKLAPTITRHAGRQIQKLYKIQKNEIGHGAFAKVFKGYSIENHDFTVAVKVVSKLSLGEADLKAVGDEVKALRVLDHPNIVKYYETFEDPKYLFIVTNFVEGTTLSHQLKIKKGFSESDTFHIIHQLASAIKHGHTNNVSHRDIKPENIMIDDNMNVTLIDFGLSKLTSKNMFKSIIGSPMYMAPEVYQGKYTNKGDIWSLGVLMYHLLSGSYPYKGSTIEEIQEKIQSFQLDFSGKAWKDVSSDAIKLIQKGIVNKPKNRISAEQFLDDKWFNGQKDDGSDDESTKHGSSKDILASLRNFECNSKLKMVGMQMIAKMYRREDLLELQREFEIIDESQDGIITYQELKEALRSADVDITDDEVKKILKKGNFSQNNRINYSDFLAVTLDNSKFKDPDMVNTLIKMFDQDGKGTISKSDIERVFLHQGKKLTKSQLADIMRIHDPEETGYISYNDFKEMLSEN